MKITTDRLDIIALTPEQLTLWTKDIAALEKELGCSYRAEPVEGIFRGIVCGQALRAQKQPECYQWHTFWFIIRRSDGVVVGSVDFKDVPDENGEVEIGYGLGREFEHSGYMTETVGAFCEWGLAQPGVRHIIAETETDNFASQRVLTRCGFAEYARDKTVWWRL